MRSRKMVTRRQAEYGNSVILAGYSACPTLDKGCSHTAQGPGILPWHAHKGHLTITSTIKAFGVQVLRYLREFVTSTQLKLVHQCSQS
jgi:hypothetical protein